MSANPVDAIQLIDYDERFSPPGKVMRLARVEDTVFLSICDYEETHTTTFTQEVAKFAVDVGVLRRALDLFDEE